MCETETGTAAIERVTVCAAVDDEMTEILPLDVLIEAH